MAACRAEFERVVSNTDHGIREQPRCSDVDGHVGAHSSASGLAWTEGHGPVWRTAAGPAAPASEEADRADG